MEEDLIKDDVVVGITASGHTPYVLGGLEYAKKLVEREVALQSCRVCR